MRGLRKWDLLVREAQRTILYGLLHEHGGNVTQVAKDLGIQRTYVHKLLKALDVRRSE